MAATGAFVTVGTYDIHCPPMCVFIDRQVREELIQGVFGCHG